MTFDEEFLELYKRYRDIETLCPNCRGRGFCAYGSTSTWCGGMGGSMVTNDVCDKCWGSGDETNPATDLRKLRSGEQKRIAEGASKFLAERCGTSFHTLRPAIEELASELDTFSRQRRKRQHSFDIVTICLAKYLRELLGATNEPV